MKEQALPTYGINSDQIPIPVNQPDMREAIRKERRAELAFKNSKYFDVRRRCISTRMTIRAKK